MIHLTRRITDERQTNKAEAYNQAPARHKDLTVITKMQAES